MLERVLAERRRSLRAVCVGEGMHVNESEWPKIDDGIGRNTNGDTLCVSISWLFCEECELIL